MDGKIAIVTGGSGILGAALIAELRSQGATTVSVDVGSLPGKSEADLFLPGIDLTDEAQAAAAVAKVIELHGTIDVLANVAGGFAWEKVADGAIGTWDRLYRLNVVTALTMSRAAIPHLLGSKGAIVNVGAAGASKAAAGMGAYAAAKSGVARLTEALAEELKEAGVRVNAVLPTMIDTPQNRADMPDADFGRWVSPQSLARVIAFLASSQADAVTGALVPVSGRL